MKRLKLIINRIIIKYMLKINKKNIVLGRKSIFDCVVFSGNNYLGRNSQIYNSSIGYCSYIGENTFVNNTEIGMYCSIGPAVRIGPGRHPTTKFVTTSPFFYSKKDFKNFSYVDKDSYVSSLPVFIGNDVWIACNVIILDGVTIHDGAIIAAGSIVAEDVPAYSIVGGIPAKVIKYRFEKHQIEFLLKYKWWNKPSSWLMENVELFHDIDNFILKTENVFN